MSEANDAYQAIKFGEYDLKLIEGTVNACLNTLAGQIDDQPTMTHTDLFLVAHNIHRRIMITICERLGFERGSPEALAVWAGAADTFKHAAEVDANLEDPDRELAAYEDPDHVDNEPVGELLYHGRLAGANDADFHEGPNDAARRDA